MREIKFRAWNIIVERMQFFNLEEIENQKGKIQWQNLIIMQYTGLKDKNGNEIYEGDIVLLDHWRSSDIFNYDIPFEVQYYDGELNFKQGDYNNFKGSLHGKLNIEVLGNIHQNPELLNQKP